ncbi:MAG: hypothetical protein ACF8R7_05580 [Phycisphaerales bacterium JB039]
MASRSVWWRPGAAALGAGAALVCGAPASAQLIDASWLSAASGNWSDDAAWSSAQFPTQRGPDDYRAIVSVTGSPFTITLDTSVVLAEFDLISSDATVAGAGGSTIVVQDVLTLNDASLLGVAGVSSQGSLIFAGDICDDICDTPLDHTGASVEWNGTGDILLGDGTVFTHGAGSVFTIGNAARLFWDGVGARSELVNNGKILKSSAGTTTFEDVLFTNNGDVCVTDGQLTLDNVGLVGLTLAAGAWEVSGDADLNIAGAAYTGLDARVVLDSPASTFGAIDSLADVGPSGFFRIRNGRNFVTTGDLSVSGDVRVGETGTSGSVLTVNGSLNNNGSVRLAPGAGTMFVTGGTHNIGSNGELGGEGIHFGAVTNNGLVDPGADGTESPNNPGQLIIASGVYEQGENGRIRIEIGGLQPGLEHDVLQVDQALFDPMGDLLAGTLEIQLIDGFIPGLSDTFEVFRYAERVGQFAAFDGLMQQGITFQAFFTDNALVLQVVEVPAPSTVVVGAMALGLAGGRRRRAAR